MLTTETERRPALCNCALREYSDYDSEVETVGANVQGNLLSAANWLAQRSMKNVDSVVWMPSIQTPTLSYRKLQTC
jgi:hypothetical protein